MIKMSVPQLASILSSDRINGKNQYKLINKYTGPLPTVITIKREDKQ